MANDRRFDIDSCHVIFLADIRHNRTAAVEPSRTRCRWFRIHLSSRIFAVEHEIVNLDASYCETSCDGSRVQWPSYTAGGRPLCCSHHSNQYYQFQRPPATAGLCESRFLDQAADACRVKRLQNRVHPTELLASIYHSVGINPTSIVYNHLNQPRELVKGDAVSSLFA